MIKTLLAPIVLAIILLSATLLYIYSPHISEKIDAVPTLEIEYPQNGSTVNGIVIIRGTVNDIDNDVKYVEIKVDDGNWERIDGKNWSYYLDTRFFEDGPLTIYVRAWDGKTYSDVKRIEIYIENKEVEVHRWALFVGAANIEDSDKKLGNGILYLAEKMAKYLIKNLSYPPNHVTILFDDGWIRDKNGEGDRICTLKERRESIEGVTYGPATKEYLVSSIEKIKEDVNKYEDSEVFIWISGHGVGDPDKFAGGKILDRSKIILWDDILSDKELGDLLSDIEAKLCLIVDSCYSGGFANRLIFNIPSLLKSGIPKDGRIVITGESKFSLGYAGNLSGPLFTQLWFHGLESGAADGFKRGILSTGRRTWLPLFRDGKVSVEEAFYYARWCLRWKYRYHYILMQPQINDMYPHAFPFNRGEMFLGK